VIEAAYGARSAAQFKGYLIDLGPDHYARLAGAKRYLEFAAAGRAVPKDAGAEETRTITLADLKRAIEEQKSEESVQ
jgi:uncharacterized protein YciI